MPRYNTNQRRELTLFLQNNPDMLLSAAQISERVDMSISAVYRNLEVLENEGKVTRHAKDGCREILYRYTAAECCADALHMTCTVCGRTFHMTADTAARMCELICGTGFSLDRAKTVIYGVCTDCGGNV
ncbi:MAG: transcriptional repressor [Oscillospiraceae bacterium]|nr:transcriptional repressor [Oscillospiraceae bacterium]